MTDSRAFAALDDTFDVVIIGGGATGLGAAVDAISRGYKTALVEAADFANATSSRSTKLVHGGVRYLQQGDVGLVREALHERSALRRNAPHLVSDLGFLCPAYRWHEAPYYFAGLTLYDVLAGASNFGRSQFLTAKRTLERSPALRKRGLRGSIRYHDGQFDDARLAVALARTAIDRGAVVVNYARAVGLERSGARVAAVRVRDEEGSGEATVRGRAFVNATGIFTDEMRRIDNAEAHPLLSLSRGSHLTLAHEVFQGEDALLVPKTDDGRVLFVVPWHGRVIVGTTDIAEPSPSLDPVPTSDEIDYMLTTASRYLERPLERSMVTAAFCGLRPLINRNAATTAKQSREHLIETSMSGLVSIAGGKWTTYRKMAEDVIDAAREVGGLAAAPSTTVNMPLHGANGDAARPGLPNPLALYGTDQSAIAALIAEDPALGKPIHPALPYTCAEVVFAARHELARTVDDTLSRRTRAFFVDLRASVESAPMVAQLLARELGHDDAWAADSAAAYKAIAQPTLALL
jgi:glycerol-3-phosphate dehydrogenase